MMAGLEHTAQFIRLVQQADLVFDDLLVIHPAIKYLKAANMKCRIPRENGPSARMLFEHHVAE
jgi:hypothetical protein